MNKNVGYLKYCEVCHKPFEPTSNRQRYCTVCGPTAKHANHVARCRAYHYKTYEYKGYNQTGENNNRLKRGTGSGRKYEEYSKFKKLKCEHCGCDGTGTRLVVHHRDGNPTNNAPSNLITLCDSCHKLVHSGKIILDEGIVSAT